MSQQRSIENGGHKYIYGLNLTRIVSVDPEVSDEITISAGACRNTNNLVDLFLKNDLTINIAASGVNGLDVGTVALNTMYAVYIIGDSTKHNPTQAIFSTAFDKPVLPFGYDSVRRIGAVATAGNAESITEIKNFIQYGTGETRTMYYESQVGLLNGGGEVVFTPITVSPWAPPIFCEGIFKILMNGGNPATTNLKLRPILSLSAMGMAEGSVFDTIIAPIGVENGEAKIEYKIAGALGSAFLSLTGYLDTL